MTLTLRPDGLWQENTPTHCPQGHAVAPGRVLVGWDGRRRVYRCLECEAG